MNDGDTGVLELEVIALRRESDCVLSVELADPEKRALPEWKPGAHIDLGLPEHIRQYSLVGDPRDCHRYRIAVLREPESSGGSQYVHTELRPGELVEIGGPRNNFPLADADRYLMIAGGVGITPLLPMIRDLHAQQKDWRLLYGGRSRRSMAYLEELAAYGDRVDVRPFDEYGHLDLAFELADPSARDIVYCCGPEGLISAVEKLCESWPAGALHVERFSARPRDDEDDLHAFELVLARSGQRFTVPAESSALDVLDAAGVALPNACRDGVCGSCETRVLAGLPLHRDALADPDRTDIVYPCVSRAQSAELVLDL
ncbi:PDR/VanB family oxidoreductase [Rhodococcus artemisiae]|uniref:PDR/VanB family oxidoreductase n=1 Tax=Rhodococcus artemisiae TaxID=714159 RepID=A0ABU7LFJ2_9NOCA|nr:PDR/VanB family oxidoreductase [Rhodococcus artemisiae]MEE2060315.1 PDR/VanB family oxidoreductase [Rhodococcus artemisiae]